jgi:hypothetical protein
MVKNSDYSEPVYKMMKERKMVELEIHRIGEFVQDRIVEKNCVEGNKMMLIDHSMKKISMYYDYYSLLVIIP